MILEQLVITRRTILIDIPNHPNSQFAVVVNEAASGQQGAKPITESAERNQSEIFHTLNVYFLCKYSLVGDIYALHTPKLISY